MKKTKIIATIGPASEQEDILENLGRSGVNVIRFNFSHAQQENVLRLKRMIDVLNAAGKTDFSCLADTKGPEIRTGDLLTKLRFKKQDRFGMYVDSARMPDDGHSLLCDYPYILEDLHEGDIVEIDSGLLKTRVVSMHEDHILLEALNDASIGSRRHVNLPGKKIKLPGLTEKDKEDVLFAIRNGFSFIAQSFVRTKENVLELRSFLDENGAPHVKIISKIENAQGVENLLEILSASDGIMVARGDLGIETPIEMLPIYQRQMAKQCLEHGKFVIIATQLLETMMENPFPTRAEVSDVFNSVMQKADCLMLSGETASGKYPVETVRMMSSVIREAEKQMVYKHREFSEEGLTQRDIEKKNLIRSAVFMGEDLRVDAILIFTKTGKLAKLASGYRPTMNVFAITGNEQAHRYASILFGIQPMLLDDWSLTHTVNLERGITTLIEKGSITRSSKILAITDIEKNGHEIPVLEIIHVNDFLG